MSLKRYFACSFAVHALIIAAVIFFMPAVKEKKMGKEFFTSLVSPDEFLAQKPFHIPTIKPIPHVQPGPVTSPPGKIDNSKNFPEKGTSSQLSSSSVPSSQEIGRMQEEKSLPQKPGLSQEAPIPSPREKLFDKSIINEFAKREVGKVEKEEKALSFNVRDLRYVGYLQRLKERIENIWIYPPEAAAQGIYGDLVIKFTIKKNGRLGSVELVRTSGHKNLDDAAMKALRNAEPFWPLPDEWGMESYTIMGHFFYTIYGYYIR